MRWGEGEGKKGEKKEGEGADGYCMWGTKRGEKNIVKFQKYPYSLMKMKEDGHKLENHTWANMGSLILYLLGFILRPIIW